MIYRTTYFYSAVFGLCLGLSGCGKKAELETEIVKAQTQLETLRATSDALDAKMRQLNIRSISQAGLKSMTDNQQLREEVLGVLEDDLASITANREALQKATDELQREVDAFRSPAGN